MPTPREGESKDEFIERCIPVVLDDGTADDQEQAVAVCNSIWEEGKAMDNALKTIGRTDDELRVANHIVLFGGRDLEGIASPNKNEDGSIGEYFAPDTELESRFTKAGRLPVDWEHRQAPEGEDPGVLGYVDWTTAKKTESGVWVERVLSRHNRYVQMLESLIDEGVIGTSSEADSGQVEKASDGRITRWPLMGDALTVAPMEPRMLSENALQAAKALGLLADADESVGIQPEPEARAEAVADGAEAGRAADVEENTQPTEENNDMGEQLNEERLVELLGGFKDEVKTAAKEATDEAIKAWRAEQPEINPGYPAGDNDEDEDYADKNWTFGEFLLAERSNDVKALRAMGAVPDRDKAIKDLLEGGGASGGYLVPQQQLNRILESPGIAQVIRPNGPTVIPMSGPEISIPALDQTGVPTDDMKLQLEGGVQARWVSEGGAKPEQEPAFEQVKLVAYKMAGHTQASDELLADSGVALEALLRRLFGRAISRLEDYYFINGNGVGQPLGILNADALIAVARDTANQVAYDDIANMWARLPSWSMGNAAWMVSQRALPEFLTMTDGAGNHVFMPQESGGARQNVMGSIFGRPLIVTEHLPALGTQGDVLLADLSYYLIGDRQATTIASSIHYDFVNDLTTWRFVHRFDGQPWIDGPIYISTTDTVSPFVTLAA